MMYRGRVENGTIRIDGNAVLPEGAVVMIQTLQSRPPTPDEDDLYRIGDLAVHTGVADLAENLDHYLYGHPKVGDR